MNRDHLSHLGKPDLKVGPLVLWVHGYERSDSDQFYDANWLRVTAHCGASGASVEVSGGILLTSELVGFCEQVGRLAEAGTGEALLQPIEPGFALVLKAQTLGHISGVADITPDPSSQSHRFEFNIDQSYLPAILGQLREALVKWPVRNRG